MSELLLLDRAGRRRSPATMPGFQTGRPSRNKGFRYPRRSTEDRGDPRRHAHGRGRRAWATLRGVIVVLWRAGLRIQEALALAEGDLDHGRSAFARASRQGRTSPRGRHGRVGLGRPPAMARATSRASRWPAVLCPQRPDAWSPVVECRRPNRAAAHGRRGGRPATVRSTSAPGRSRRRNGPRRRTARRHPAPARPQQPRHHLGLPPRHRQRRDRQHAPAARP
jgi:hypothetical protein